MSDSLNNLLNFNIYRLELTLSCVKAPTKAGTAKPGMVPTPLVMPIRTPENIKALIREPLLKGKSK